MKKITMFIAIAFSALFANAAASNWTGGSSGVWGADNTDNWDSYPNSSNYAKFGTPLDQTISIQVEGTVQTYGVVGAEDRTFGINFTGTGRIQNYRGTLFVASGFSLTDWDVDIENICSGEHATVNVEGTNVFHKTLDCSTAYNFNTKDKARVVLSDNARLAGQYMKVVAGSSFECADYSVAQLSKNMIVEPGASLVIADNSLLVTRSLLLPLSTDEGVSDGWQMDGGEMRISVPKNGDYCLSLPYTNATKTVSGTGTISTYKLGFDNASNLVFRLHGPNLYVGGTYFSDSALRNIMLELGGESTIGAWGSDLSFTLWSNKVSGVAVVDTTDYIDKTVGRTITMGKYCDCNGTLKVKGIGTFYPAGTGSIEQPNIGLTGEDSSKTIIQKVYALGDLVLNGSSTLTVNEYMGHQGDAGRVVKSLTMDGSSALDVRQYVLLSGDASLSGNASAVVRNGDSDSGAIMSCSNLSLADDASLVVTGQIAAATLSMSDNAHLEFTAGSSFTAGAEFEDGTWTMKIMIPSGYEAGIRPVVMGAEFDGDFAEHVTLVGETTGWSAQTIDGNLVLFKEAAPEGMEWTGNSRMSDNWSESDNWNGGNIPGADDAVAFGGIDRLTPYNDSVSSISSLVFRASAGPFVLNGSESLSLTANCSSRSSASADNAAIASHSAFDQTIAQHVTFNSNTYLLSDGAGALKLTGGFDSTLNWAYFVVGGDVQIGDTCTIAGVLSFKNSTTGTPSCMRVLPGCSLTIGKQGFHPIVETDKYVGRIIVEEGGSMTVYDGDCAFWYGGLENIVDGTLSVINGEAAGSTGRLIGGPNEQYYVGKGSIYADSARSARQPEAASHYINFGGTLKLYMNGNWYTATYEVDGSTVVQDPNYPTRFRMTDGTTLGATKDWTYGPMDTIANTLTPAQRASIMTGTVTVNTQSPTDDSAHTITFVDPLNATEATIVKTGAGTLRFNESDGYKSQIGNLTVNAGGVSFAAAPTLSGTLTIASAGAKFEVDGLAQTSTWELVATADDIVGPSGQTKWNSSVESRRFKIESDGSVKKLYSSHASGLTIIFR